MEARSVHIPRLILKSNPSITFKVKNLLSDVVLSQQTESPLTCRLELCPMHPDERKPKSSPKQKKDILEQMIHTRTRYVHCHLLLPLNLV